MGGRGTDGDARSARVSTRRRILQGTFECVARWGLARTTVEEAARQAGVSRATLYRYFPGGREELVDAVVVWELVRFFARLYDDVRDVPSLPGVLQRGLVFARQAMLQHQVLQRLLVTEPEILLPKMTTETERIVAMVAAFLMPYLARETLADGVDVHEAAEYLAHMTLSTIAAPGSWDLTDPVQVADLVRTEFLAGILAR